jgi:ribonuclease HII
MSLTTKVEANLWSKGLKQVAGMDEVGRGCLAGPVTVGVAVVNPNSTITLNVADSKQLSALKRIQLAKELKTTLAAWSVGSADNIEIDKLGIVPATILAASRALAKLSQIEMLLIDGNPSHHYQKAFAFPYQTLVKGDQAVYSIAAASILAKVARDEYMHQLAAELPDYDWRANVGYGTKRHIEMLKKQGLSPYHRKYYCRNYGLV